MVQVTVEEAATRLPQLLTTVERGEDVVIVRHGIPIARLVPVVEPAPRPVGFLSGSVPESSFEPLPEDELQRWE